MKLSEHIARIRSEARLTRRAMASVCGVHESTVGRWETGETIPQREHIARMARACKLTMKQRTELAESYLRGE